MKAIRWLACVLALATLALATIGLMGLRSAAPIAAAGATLYVDDDGACGGNTPCYTTIQAAVNAANEGDTILVYPGTYDPQVNIAVPCWGGTYPAQGIVVWKANLTIRAVDPDPANTVIQNTLGAWMDWWRIQRLTGGEWTGCGTNQTGGFNPGTSASPNALMIVKSGVTIEGFTIHDPVIGTPSSGYNGSGVMIGGVAPGDPNSLGADNNVVTHNVFSNVWQAVYMWHSSGNQITDNRIAALGNTGHWAGISIYDGYISDQINLGFPSKNNVIQRNTLVDKGISVGAWQPPIPTDNSGTKIIGNTVNGNIAFYYTASSGVEISDNNTLAGPWSGGQILFDGGSTFSSPVVKDNTVGAGNGNGIQLQYVTGGSVSGNIVSGRSPTGNGIALLDTNGVAITGNTTTDNAASGIVLVRTSNVTVSGNTILRNAGVAANPGGLTIREGAGSTTVVDNTISNNTQYGVWISSAAGTGNVFHLNNIVANGVGMLNNTAFLVDAEDNWWGSANGPTHASNKFNVGSQGQSVSDNVDFVPWHNAAPPGGASFAPVTTTSPVGSYASIQAGVNASSGGTVDAKAGTFSEQVSIATANLTLDGAGLGSTIVKPATAPANTTSLYSGAPIATIILVNGVTGVTVKHLTVDGSAAAFNSCSPGYMGIFYRNASGTIDSARVTSIFHPSAPGCQSVIGIFAQSGGGGGSTVQVSNSTVDNYGKNGITCNEPGTACTLTGNTVTGRGPVGSGDAAQNGIQLGFGATGTVDGNTVSNNSYTGSDWAATDVLVVSADAGITGNHLNNGQLGLYYIDGSGTISGNTVTATTAGVGRSDYWGIDVSDPPNLSASPFEPHGGASPSGTPPAGFAAPASPAVMTVLVNGNTLTGNGSVDSVGLEADAGWGPQNVNFTASGNTISNWGTGVVVAQCDSGCSGAVFTSVDVGPDNSISAPIADTSNSGLHAMGSVDLNVHNNTFTGGYDAVRLRLSVTGTVKDNLMSGYAKNGITVGKAADDNTGTNVTVSGNTVTGGGPGQVNAQNGIQVGPNAVARIENNTVSNHVYTLGPGACAGPGTKGDKAYYDACWTAAGIMVYQGTATVTGNVITGNQVGIDDSGAQVHYNEIRGNILYGENNSSGGVANAENNWWGACSGPTHSSNPLGTGDAVSDNVDFTPWISGACDYDSDLLTDDQERLIIGTDWQNPDTDGDGCADGEEVLMPKNLGGGRNPLNPYDFYDITNSTFVVGAKDKVVSGLDLSKLLAYGNTRDGGPCNAGGNCYDDDNNGNGIDDGREMDFVNMTPGPPSGPDGAISGLDLSKMLGQGGDSCAGPP